MNEAIAIQNPLSAQRRELARAQAARSLPGSAKSREHVLLSLLAERRFRAGQSADLNALVRDLAEPPIDQVGALGLNDCISKSDRKALTAALLASPTSRAGAKARRSMSANG
ncbi:MAG TPA: hypothetical protein VHW01_15515 [Polyangiaceae bacterium]|nr:hypothetical protein [Polyangiaceae bacterium]